MCSEKWIPLKVSESEEISRRLTALDAEHNNVLKDIMDQAKVVAQATTFDIPPFRNGVIFVREDMETPIMVAQFGDDPTGRCYILKHHPFIKEAVAVLGVPIEVIVTFFSEPPAEKHTNLKNMN